MSNGMVGRWGLLGLTVGCLIACSNGRSGSSPEASPIAVTSSSPSAAPSPSPTLAGNPLERGQDKATGARTLAEAAKTPDDWKLVVIQWQQAIRWLQAVPKSSPDRKTAEQLLPEYRQALMIAQAQIRRSLQPEPKQSLPPSTKGSGEPLLLVGGGSETVTGSSPPPSDQEAVAHLKQMQQRQMEWATQTNTFAPTIAALTSSKSSPSPGSTTPSGQEATPPESQNWAETTNFTYQMTLPQPTQVVILAIPKQDKLPSYSSLVLRRAQPSSPFLTQICRTSQASRTPPAVPQLRGDGLQCPNDSQSV